MKRFCRLAAVLSVCVLFLTAVFSSTVVYAEENTNHEKEKNNSIKKANTLDIGVVTVGKLSSKSDVDYFKIMTTTTGDILFHFAHEADGVYAYYWYAEVLDADKNVLNEGNLSGKDPTDFSVKAVKPGTYYLKISKASGGNPFTIGFTKDPYMITVTTECLTHAELSDWETTLEASCRQAGERCQRCTACKTIVVTESIAKLDHVFTDWSVTKEAEFLQPGERKRTCTLCGEIAEETFLSEISILALIVGGAVLLIVIIAVAVVRNKREKRYYSRSYSSYSSSSSSSSSGSSPSSSNSSSNSYGGYSYSSDSYGSYNSSSYDDTYTPPPYDGSITIGSETYGVRTYDAEGYSTQPYIEDAEGYKTYVDPADVSPPFNWLDC